MTLFSPSVLHQKKSSVTKDCCRNWSYQWPLSRQLWSDGMFSYGRFGWLSVEKLKTGGVVILYNDTERWSSDGRDAGPLCSTETGSDRSPPHCFPEATAPIFSCQGSQGSPPPQLQLQLASFLRHVFQTLHIFCRYLAGKWLNLYSVLTHVLIHSHCDVLLLLLGGVNEPINDLITWYRISAQTRTLTIPGILGCIGTTLPYMASYSGSWWPKSKLQNVFSPSLCDESDAFVQKGSLYIRGGLDFLGHPITEKDHWAQQEVVSPFDTDTAESDCDPGPRHRFTHWNPEDDVTHYIICFWTCFFVHLDSVKKSLTPNVQLKSAAASVCAITELRCEVVSRVCGCLCPN